MPDMRQFNQTVINEFRANSGKVGGQMAGIPLLLITMKGAKTGRSLTVPLAYTTDGSRCVIIASKAGAPNNPDWYHNLIAHPVVTVELGGERFQARATEAGGAERDRLYTQQAAQLPIFADYQKKTTRRIPVFTLERIA
ncbi:MAG TPA: nitroreductase family deazaflavin-dependent oxidoreductase [Candidatus Binataceae bacterium]|nr:nitroreductase family deazaflavin-dependent oxidoreductase [Candidatus Binataceae bacterium]